MTVERMIEILQTLPKDLKVFQELPVAEWYEEVQIVSNMLVRYKDDNDEVVKEVGVVIFQILPEMIREVDISLQWVLQDMN